jgi:hypothetical protein
MALLFPCVVLVEGGVDNNVVVTVEDGDVTWSSIWDADKAMFDCCRLLEVTWHCCMSPE